MHRAISSYVFMLALLVGCSSTIPVNGRMERSEETFQGNIAGSGLRGGTGELVLSSSRKTTCRGTFVNTTRLRGEGALNCDDGRTGWFRIAGSRGVGNGLGELSGSRFTFTFQDVE
jgi:hypothetical protein